MIPAKVQFTDLEFDPVAVADRWHRGVIPLNWHRYRFTLRQDIQSPVNRINRWLFNNIEGRWAIWIRYSRNIKEVNLAFESNVDGVTFVLADGKTEAFREEVP